MLLNPPYVELSPTTAFLTGFDQAINTAVVRLRSEGIEDHAIWEALIDSIQRLSRGTDLINDSRFDEMIRKAA